MDRKFELAPDERSIGLARQHVRDVARGRVSTERLAEAQLVVSELVTNAVRHGPGRPIVLRLAIDREGALSGEVEDQGNGHVVIRRHSAPGREVGGLGLPIVESLTEDWGVYPGSTHVWFRLGV